jgi:hypothetical protein
MNWWYRLGIGGCCTCYNPSKLANESHTTFK